MKYIRRCAASISVVLLLHSCATKPAGLLLDTKTIDVETLITLVRKHQDQLQSMAGHGTVTFESPEIAGTASFQLALKKPDSLLVTFEGPFGIDIGTLFVSSGKYLMYNSMENTVVTGVPSNAAIRSIIPFDLTLDQIIGAFSGSFNFPSDRSGLISYSVDDEMFMLSYKCGINLCKYWVDSRYVLVKKYEMLDEHGMVIMTAESSSFAEDGTAGAPKRIRIVFPGQNRQLAVNYSTMTLNEPELSFTYSVPSNARTIIR
jgi:outer membrane lipoprotein-sorting protein